MREMLWVMGMGAIGALSRFGVTKLVERGLGTGFPYGTLIANVVGCLAIGVIMAAKLPIPKVVITGLVVGYLGALTTFSSFGFATFSFFKSGDFIPGIANIAANLILGLLAVWVGVLIGRSITG